MRLEPLRLLARGRLEVVAAASLLLAPFGDIGVHLAAAGLERGAIDGDLEARMEHDLARPALVLGDHLGGDVAPPDDGQRPAIRRPPADRSGEIAETGLPLLEVQTEPVGCRPGPARRVPGPPSARGTEPPVVAEVKLEQLGVLVQPEAAPHDPLEVPCQEIGQVERADLFLLERFERRGAGIELVAVGAGDALDALEVALQHPVEETARAAVGVRHEDPVVVAAPGAQPCGDRVGNTLGAVVQLGRETRQVDPGQAPCERHELAPERATADDENPATRTGGT